MRVWGRLGLRARLLVTIGGGFLLGAVLLVLLQYLVVRQALSSSAGAWSGPGAEGADPAAAVVLSRVEGQLLPVLVVVAAGAGLGAWLVASRVARQLATITETVRQIHSNDLSQRLPLGGPHDELWRLRQVMNQMLDRLDAAFERQRSFLSNAAHELRTPITTIRTTVQVAQRLGRVPEELSDEVSDVLAASQRLEELVAALLLVARGDRGQGELLQVDLAALVGEVVDQLAQEVDRRRIHLDWQPPTQPVEVNAHPVLLRALLSNLVGNAVQHNRDDGWVRVSLGAEGDQVRLQIANSGRQELSTETATRLLEPFNRGDRSRQTDSGLGLGLNVVDSAVAWHQGRLRLQPSGDQGLEVTVELPVTAR